MPSILWWQATGMGVRLGPLTWIVYDLFEVVVDNGRQVLFIQFGAIAGYVLNPCTVENVDQPAAVLLGATNTDVLYPVFEACTGQSSTARG